MLILEEKRRREVKWMDLFEGPLDVFGAVIYSVLTRRMENNQKYKKFINSLEEKIEVRMDYNPLLLDEIKATNSRIEFLNIVNLLYEKL